MTAIGIPVNRSNWVALRTKYELDSNIELFSDYTISNDGYTTYLQPIYKGGRDIALNKQTLFCLPQSLSLFSFMADMGKYNIYTAAHGHLSTIIDDVKYYVGITSCSYPYLKLITEKSDDTFFSIRPTKDGLFQFVFKDDFYVTVNDKEPFLLYLSNKFEDEEDQDRQQFSWSDLGNNKFSFFTKIKDRFNLNTSFIERAWSYRNFGKYKKFIRANGMVHDIGYNLINDNIFNGEGLQLYINRDGLKKDHTWVSYYSQIDDKDYNRTVKVKLDNSPSNIAIHHLTDLPYNSKVNIETKELLVNIANTKSVMTEGYEYKINSNFIAGNPFYEQKALEQGCNQIYTTPPKPIASLPNDVVCGLYSFINDTSYPYATTDWDLFIKYNTPGFTKEGMPIKPGGKYKYYAKLKEGCARRIVWCPKVWTTNKSNYLTDFNYIWRLAKFTTTSKRILAIYDSDSTSIASSRPYTFTPLDLPKGDKTLLPSPIYITGNLDSRIDLNKFLSNLHDDNPAGLYPNDIHSITTTVRSYYYRISDGKTHIADEFAGYKIEYCIHTENNRTSIDCGVPTILPTFTLSVNVSSIPPIPALTADPACPRVATWSPDILYQSQSYTIPGSFTDSVFSQEPSAGIDIYTWYPDQSANISFTGPGYILTSFADDLNNQIRTKVYYTIPGDYSIIVSIINL